MGLFSCFGDLYRGRNRVRHRELTGNDRVVASDISAVALNDALNHFQGLEGCEPSRQTGDLWPVHFQRTPPSYSRCL